MANDEKKPSRLVKSSFFLINWLTPVGILKIAYKADKKQSDDILNGPSHKVRVIRSVCGMIVAGLGVIGSIYGVVTNTPNSGEPLNRFSLVTAIFFIIAGFCVVKFLTYFKIFKQIIASQKEREPSAAPTDNSFTIDEAAASTLLFRITVFKYCYAMACAFSLILLLSPTNIHGIQKMMASEVIGLNDVTLSLAISISLSLIFFLKYVTAKKDVALILRHGASPTLHGYVTINNYVYQIVNLMILTLAVAFVGDAIIKYWASSTHVVAGWFLIVASGVMIAFSVTMFRTGINLSGLLTDEKKSNLDALSCLFLKPCMLPKPDKSAPALKIPNVSALVVVSFAAAIVVANLTGLISLFVLIPLVLLQGLALAIDEFHEEVMERYGE